MRSSLWLLLLAVPSTGQAQEALTLDAALAAALARHPTVALADAGVARAAASRREAGAGELPALSVDATLTRFEEPMIVAPLHGFDPQRLPVFDRTLAQGSLTLGYTAWDGGARRSRQARAGAQVDALRETAAAQHEALIAETVRRFTSVLTLRDVAAAHAARVTSLEQERARAERLYTAGRAARVVLLRAEAALSSAQADAVAATSQVDVAERALARLMSVADSVVRGRALADPGLELHTPARAAALQEALASSRELLRLRAQVAAAAAGVREAQSQSWPRVQLGGRYVRYGSGAGDAGGEWQAGVQLSYPLFTAGARPAALERARAEHRVAAAELAVAEQRVLDDVDRADALLAAARARVTSLDAAVTQTEEVARIEKLALDTGAGVQTDYLAAEASLLAARAALTEARHAEILALVELLRAAGALSMETMGIVEIGGLNR